jgi:hypothetical protein
MELKLLIAVCNQKRGNLIAHSNQTGSDGYLIAGCNQISLILIALCNHLSSAQ